MNSRFDPTYKVEIHAKKGYHALGESLMVHCPDSPDRFVAQYFRIQYDT